MRSLRNEVLRLAAALGVTRCACGAILPRALLRPRPVAIVEEIDLPPDLEALEEQATPEEAGELQTILNRCLERHPDAEATELRFRFADSFDTGPQCPSCSARVDHGKGIRFISVGRPAPDGLLDTFLSEPLLAARFAELKTAIRRRAASSKEGQHEPANAANDAGSACQAIPSGSATRRRAAGAAQPRRVV
jgi:hypothetical protein